MNDLLNITLIIAERKYTLSIERKDEEVIRQAAKMINDRIKEFSQQYQYTDKRDLLSMVTLRFTAALLKADATNDYMKNNLEENLTSIHTMLQKAV